MSFPRTLAVLACLAAPMVALPQDTFFDSNGVSIRYREQGQGEPIVLLHGAGNSTEFWFATGVFQDLAKDYRVIVFDLRGHGKSGKPHDPKQYGIEMSLDVVRLLDKLKITRAHIVGYSLGGTIAALGVTLHPERFQTATFAAGAFCLRPRPNGFAFRNYRPRRGSVNASAERKS
jgi:pimeloyl-ACP methyl ester carboxylesterase